MIRNTLIKLLFGSKWMSQKTELIQHWFVYSTFYDQIPLISRTTYVTICWLHIYHFLANWFQNKTYFNIIYKTISLYFITIIFCTQKFESFYVQKIKAEFSQKNLKASCMIKLKKKDIRIEFSNFLDK